MLLSGVERRFFGFRLFDQLGDAGPKLIIKHPLHDQAIARDLLVQLLALVAHRNAPAIQ
jgi:hypothetical protein